LVFINVPIRLIGGIVFSTFFIFPDLELSSEAAGKDDTEYLKNENGGLDKLK
jgi:hypothetical protein